MRRKKVDLPTDEVINVIQELVNVIQKWPCVHKDAHGNRICFYGVGITLTHWLFLFFKSNVSQVTPQYPSKL